MKFSANLLLSCEILTAHKLRTLLSITGIVVGVGAVVMMVSVGHGAQKRVLESIRNMGTNLIVITAGQTRIMAGRELQIEIVTSLTPDDARATEQNCPSVVIAAPVVTDRVSAVWEAENTNTTMLGMSTEGFKIREIKIASGRIFDPEEDRARRRLAVIGPTVAQNLFPEMNPIGLQFRIGRVPFKVIGITEPKGTDINGLDLDDVIIVPLETAMRRFLNIPYVHSIFIQARDNDALQSAEQEIKDILRQRHRLAPGVEDDFTIQNQATLLAAERETAQSMTLLTSSVAGISLLVGGVGILAVMLISVRERTMEIGLRRALGAGRKDISTQFLAESVILSLSGGIIGIVSGIIAAMGLSIFGYWDAAISWPAAALGFFFSVSVGIIFGIYPAVRAARLEPIDALRAV